MLLTRCIILGDLLSIFMELRLRMHVTSLRQEREGRRDTELKVTESFNYAPLDFSATYSSGRYLHSSRISGSEILSLGFKQ